jgi:hypothetical protein
VGQPSPVSRQGHGGGGVQQAAYTMTFEEIADQWNLIPGVLPVRFSDVETGRGIHKAVMAAI